MKTYRLGILPAFFIMIVSVIMLFDRDLNYTKGSLVGFQDYAIGATYCVIDVVIHPIATLQEAYETIRHPLATLEAATSYINTIIEGYPALSAYEKGRLWSRLTFETLAFFIPISWSKVGLVRMEAHYLRVKLAIHQQVQYGLAVLPHAWSTRLSTHIQRLQPVSFLEWFASEGQPASR